MTVSTDPTDRLRRHLAADLDRHFDDLVITFQQQLYAYAYRMTNCREEAEEIVQDVFIRAHRSLGTYDSERILALSLRAWLYKICINLIRNRARSARPRTEEWDADRHLPADDSSDPTAEFSLSREQAASLRDLVSTLPDHYRSAILLRYMNELTYAEISDAMHLPEGTVKSHVHRALGLLRHAVGTTQGE